MTIKTAFSTVACPEWTLEQVVEQARSLGYDGVELRTLGPSSAHLSSDPGLVRPEKVGEIFAGSGVEPVCLSTSTVLDPSSSTTAYRTHWETVAHLEAARTMGCRMVRVFAAPIAPGHSRESFMQKLARLVVPIADRAGELGMQLLLENAGTLSTAKPWWGMLNLIEHPMVRLSWNVANAAAMGESHAISVPMLNSRIALVKVKDTKLGTGAGYCQLGDGDIGIEPLIHRLRGLGYTGHVSVEWDRLWLPNLAPADEILPEALTRLKTWAGLLETDEPDGKKKKAAAK